MVQEKMLIPVICASHCWNIRKSMIILYAIYREMESGNYYMVSMPAFFMNGILLWSVKQIEIQYLNFILVLDSNNLFHLVCLRYHFDIFYFSRFRI